MQPYRLQKRAEAFERPTLLTLPWDMMSAMPLAASFFSATHRTRLICARFRIMSAGCLVSGHRAFWSAQEHLCLTPSRSIPDARAGLLSRRCSIPSCAHQRPLLLRFARTLSPLRSVSMLAARAKNYGVPSHKSLEETQQILPGQVNAQVIALQAADPLNC